MIHAESPVVILVLQGEQTIENNATNIDIKSILINIFQSYKFMTQVGKSSKKIAITLF